MIIHGLNDPRVHQSESDRFVEELKKNDIPVTYIQFPDEGWDLLFKYFYAICYTTF